MAKYVNSADRAEDNRSSAWTLLLVGGIGLIVIILGAFDIIPLPISGFSKLLTSVVLGGLCVIFVVMGIVSFKKSKVYATQAAVEGDREAGVFEWFEENYPAEKMDEMLGGERFELSVEELYFKRYALIRQILFMNFKDSGLEFLDHMADEVYERFFGDE